MLLRRLAERWDEEAAINNMNNMNKGSPVTTKQRLSSPESCPGGHEEECVGPLGALGGTLA